MKSFKQYITEAKKDLPAKGNPSGMSPGDIEKWKSATPGERPDTSGTDYDTTNRRTRSRIHRTGRTIRKRGSATPASTPKPPVEPLKPSATPKVTDVDPTNVNKFIRGEAEKGRAVSQPLADTAGVRDAARRGEIKPVQAGETKPASGATNRARARGAAARQGVDISSPESKLKPRNQRLGDTTKGGPVKVIKPTQPAPAPKPEAVKKPVPTLSRRGALARKVDPILKDILKQGESRKALETRMSKGYDFNIIRRRGDELLNQLRKDSKPAAAPKPFAEPTSKPRVVRGADTLAKPPKPPKPTTYRNLGIGPETAGRSLNIKGVRASAPVRAPRPQRYSNLGLGQERAGQRVVNRPVEIRVKSQPKTQLPKPPASSKVVANRVVQQMQDAAKKKAASNVRTLGRIGKGLGVVGAGLEAQGEYMRRKEDLKQDTATAVTGAATRTGGGLTGAAIGGKLGAKLGTVFGPKGALVGGAAGSIYGYMVGADKATQGFDALTRGAKNFDPVSFTNFRKRAQSASK